MSLAFNKITILIKLIYKMIIFNLNYSLNKELYILD